MSVIKRILSREAVAHELEQMRSDLRATQRLTIDQHLTLLADIRDEARGAEQFAAAVRAEELRGRAAGFYFEQHVHVHEHTLSRDEIKARLSMLMEANPRIKELLGGVPDDEVKLIESTSSDVSAAEAVVEEAVPAALESVAEQL